MKGGSSPNLNPTSHIIILHFYTIIFKFTYYTEYINKHQKTPRELIIL